MAERLECETCFHRPHFAGKCIGEFVTVGAYLVCQCQTDGITGEMIA